MDSQEIVDRVCDLLTDLGIDTRTTCTVSFEAGRPLLVRVGRVVGKHPHRSIVEDVISVP